MSALPQHRPRFGDVLSDRSADATVGRGAAPPPVRPAGPPPAPPRIRSSRAGAAADRSSPDQSVWSQLRADYGAHLEAHYPRLVAQLYAITLDPGEAHDAVQDAYSRAWRQWAVVGRSSDPTAWVRSVAVRSTARSWRRLLARTRWGPRPPAGPGTDPRTGALLTALGRLAPADRRAVVLFHMADASLGEIAAIERTTIDTVRERLGHARLVVAEGLADVLPEGHASVVDTFLGRGYAAGDPIDDAPLPENHVPERHDLGVHNLGGYGWTPSAPDWREHR